MFEIAVQNKSAGIPFSIEGNAISGWQINEPGCRINTTNANKGLYRCITFDLIAWKLCGMIYLNSGILVSSALFIFNYKFFIE